MFAYLASAAGLALLTYVAALLHEISQRLAVIEINTRKH